MRVSALLLCLNFGLVAAAQAAEPGWYFVGFGGGSSASGLSQGQVDDNLVAIFGSVGLDVLDASSSLDDTDTGFGVAGGYQVNDYLAFEFAYVDVGSIGYRASGTVSDDVDQFAAEAELDNSADGAVCRCSAYCRSASVSPSSAAPASRSWTSMARHRSRSMA
jgi:hypothetical protein